MRYRLLATYQGAPYEAGLGPDETGVVLFAACPPPEDLHFEPATGHWRKRVSQSEVEGLYESRPVGIFRGERCVVLDDLTDRLHIAYLGHDAYCAEQLGYWEVDRGVFELITPRNEVTDIIEQRMPIAPHGEQPDSVPAHANGLRPDLTELPTLGPLTGPAGPQHFPAAGAPRLPLEAEAWRAARAGILDPSMGHSHFTGSGGRIASRTPQPRSAETTEPQGAEAGMAYPDMADPRRAEPNRADSALTAVPPPRHVARPDEPIGASSDVGTGRSARRRRAAGRRLPTHRIFSQLAAQAGIPPDAYAIDQDVDGAMCLVRTDEGFEVFNSLAGARHEVRIFDDEESAYFYLFGVLVAEALRNGILAPRRDSGLQVR